MAVLKAIRVPTVPSESALVLVVAFGPGEDQCGEMGPPV